MIVEALMPRAATPAPTDDFWYTDYPVRAGEADVSPNGALQVTAVLACVRVLAETVAQLPLHLMETDGRMRRQAIEHPLYEVLHDTPNDWQTSFEFREMMQGHVALRGNAYAQIVPGPRGAVDQLLPLHPDRMKVFRLESKRLGYLYTDRKGVEYRLTQDEVFHLRFMSLDDAVGISVITYGRVAIELAQKTDEHGIRFYRNAARPSGVITMPEGFYFKDPDDAKRLGDSWRKAHTGEDLFTVAFLEGGATWEQIGLSNEDAQWLESRRFQTVEIARLFRVPPHMIGSAIEHGHTYANVEQSSLAFMQFTMMPWIDRWEGAIKRDLVVQPTGRRGVRLYPKFNVEGLLRADSKTRAGFYGVMLDKGVYSVNEVREKEDLNPIEGGDEYKTAASPPALPPPGNQDGDKAEGGTGKAELQIENCKLQIANSPPHPLIPLPLIADAAKRIAKAEIDALRKRSAGAAADREKFNAWVRQHWGVKRRDYVMRTLTPILATGNSPVDPAALAAKVCDAAVAALTAGDPVDVLQRWKTARADEITELLIGDLDNDK